MKKLNGTVIVTYRCNARCNMCNRYKKPSKPEEELTIETIKKLHTYLKKKIKTDNIGVILYSPLPAPIDKIKNKYRWRMIIKCKFGEDIVKFINGMLEEYNKYKKNNTKISIALNPSNMS